MYSHSTKSGIGVFIIDSLSNNPAGGFAQVSKKTYKTSCGGTETSTFNSGDTVCVELTATSPSGSLSGTTVTDELPPGASGVSIPSGYPAPVDKNANPLAWTNQSIGTGTEFKYIFKMP